MINNIIKWINKKGYTTEVHEMTENRTGIFIDLCNYDKFGCFESRKRHNDIINYLKTYHKDLKTEYRACNESLLIWINN